MCSLEAFRVCLLLLWRMVPMHHRDVSIYNVLARVPARLFDYGNARWDLEPSEMQRRHKRKKSLSEDDCFTATYCFLSRASLFLDTIVDGQPVYDTMKLCEHRFWHDVESLYVLVGSCFSRDSQVKKSLHLWLQTDPDSSRTTFLDQASSLRLKLSLMKALNDRESAEIAAVSKLILARVTVLTTAGEDLFGGGLDKDKSVFEGLLKATNDAIAEPQRCRAVTQCCNVIHTVFQ